MEIDIIALLTRPGSVATVHNVRLAGVQPNDDGYERLTIEYGGSTHELLGGGKWNEQFSCRDVGKVGYLVPASLGGVPAGSCYFRAYHDQSLRRVPELDLTAPSDVATGLPSDGRAQAVVGWCCDARPNGFRAPVGIIPGTEGQFVEDETITVTVRVPPEFVRESHRVQMTPADLLRSFVGDLAGIQNYVVCPRADGYGSNGSDERHYAETWLERAHGMNAINLDELEMQAEAAEERKWQRDDFTALLDDFEAAGGKPEDLVAAVQAMVEKQRAEQ